MKKKLTYQEFLNLSEKKFSYRANSMLEISLYVYNKCLHTNSSSYDFGVRFAPSMSECLDALELLKNTYKEFFQEDYLNFIIDKKNSPISILFRTIDLFDDDDTSTSIVSQTVFTETLLLIINNLHILDTMGYDLEKIYLS